MDVDYESLTTEDKISYLERLDFSKEIDGLLRRSQIEFAAVRFPASIMLGTLLYFLKSQARIGAFTFPPSSPDLTAGVDLVALTLGYDPTESIVYRFKKVESGYTGGMESVNEVPIPTLDFFSYSQGNRRLYHVLLYDGLGSHYFKHPKDSLILCPNDNYEFHGNVLDETKFVEPQQTLLKRETEDVKLKEVDKVDLTKILVGKINAELEGLQMSWEDFKDDLKSLML